MTSVIYVVLLALLMCWLALNVVKARRKNKIPYADGGVTELQIARSAHSNAAEYIPIAMLLLLILEYNGAPLWMVHIVGVTFVVGRLMHSHSILKENLNLRVKAMQITIFSIMILSVLNIIYLPLSKIISF